MTDQRAVAMKKILQDPIVMLVAVIASAYLLTNGVMFWVSLQAPTDLVSADYYAQSKRIDERQATERASALSGLRVALAPESTRDAALVRVSDAAGSPVGALTGTANAYRPSDSRLDQPLALEPVEGQPGLFRARFATPRAGLWEIAFELEAESGVLHERVRFIAP